MLKASPFLLLNTCRGLTQKIVKPVCGCQCVACRGVALAKTGLWLIQISTDFKASTRILRIGYGQCPVDQMCQF